MIFTKLQLTLYQSIIAICFFCASHIFAQSEHKSITRSYNMMIRMAEIDVDSKYISEYSAILKESAETSMRLEKGVIAIFPMFQKENPTQIRILEVYLNKESYEAHLQTLHFKHYKTTTLKMIKSLKLVEMQPIDVETMQKMLSKIK